MMPRLNDAESWMPSSNTRGVKNDGMFAAAQKHHLPIVDATDPSLSPAPSRCWLPVQALFHHSPKRVDAGFLCPCSGVFHHGMAALTSLNAI